MIISFNQKIIFSALLLMFLVSAYQSRFSGVFNYDAGLPHGLKIESIDRHRWITDKDGFGVISPVRVSPADENRKFKLIRVTRYAFNEDALVAWYEDEKEESFCSFINKQNVERQSIMAYKASSDSCQKNSVLSENPDMKYINIESMAWPKIFLTLCLFSPFYFIWCIYQAYSFVRIRA